MATKTYCDRCGVDVQSEGVRVDFLFYSSISDAGNWCRRKDVCLDCVDGVLAVFRANHGNVE